MKKTKDFMDRYEKRRSKSVEVSIGFTQGFVCAICVLIQFYGCITTEVEDLWKSGGLRHLEDLKRYNIDEHDQQIILKYKNQLFK